MMPRCAWGAAPIQVRGPRGRLRAPGGGGGSREGGGAWPRPPGSPPAPQGRGAGRRTRRRPRSRAASFLGGEGRPAVACAAQGHLGVRGSVPPTSRFLPGVAAGRREAPREGLSGPALTAEEAGSAPGRSAGLAGTAGLAAEPPRASARPSEQRRRRRHVVGSAPPPRQAWGAVGRVRPDPHLHLQGDRGRRKHPVRKSEPSAVCLGARRAPRGQGPGRPGAHPRGRGRGREQGGQARTPGQGTGRPGAHHARTRKTHGELGVTPGASAPARAEGLTGQGAQKQRISPPSPEWQGGHLRGEPGPGQWLWGSGQYRLSGAHWGERQEGLLLCHLPVARGLGGGGGSGMGVSAGVGRSVLAYRGCRLSPQGWGPQKKTQPGLRGPMYRFGEGQGLLGPPNQGPQRRDQHPGVPTPHCRPRRWVTHPSSTRKGGFAHTWEALHPRLKSSS